MIISIFKDGLIGFDRIWLKY